MCANWPMGCICRAALQVTLTVRWTVAVSDDDPAAVQLHLGNTKGPVHPVHRQAPPETSSSCRTAAISQDEWPDKPACRGVSGSLQMFWRLGALQLPTTLRKLPLGMQAHHVAMCYPRQLSSLMQQSCQG